MMRYATKPLAEVCTITMGQSPPSNTYNDLRNGLPFFQGKADFGALHPVNRIYCSNPIKTAGANSVLLSVRAPVGAVNIAKEKCCIGRGLAAISGKSGIIHNKYIYYFLKSIEQKLAASGVGSTFSAIGKKEIENIQIPFPSLETQRKIAAVLDKAQELIDKRRQQIALLDDFIQSVFIDMFGDPILNSKGWETTNLVNVCRKITDGTHHSPVNIGSGDYVYLTAKNIRKDKIDLTDVTYVSEEDHKNIYARCNPEYGDILYIKDGVTTGIAQINTLDFEFSMLSSIALLKLNRDLVSEYFVKSLLNNVSMYQSIRENMGGAAITRLTIKKIEAIKIICPPMSLQMKFAKLARDTDNQILLMQQSLAQMENAFNSLMQRAFKGELF